ncbi:electron transport complex protein RnfD [Sporomusaceae bacterium BoRhaA]|uniref:RnfABCDGE type electron transport complex subunit D n=1 Tax=Pelorhabdus rhamnosifermentans TaxID=2772457 RepID=UPI001C061A33|nr:RnfABCDGE type electron transport complex subunit D [Pelorhabdus rhamnosifermentans]MBU2701860.1 electron transport complex protein RnfD [Pelorhabdus rhamnosifermentans]
MSSETKLASPSFLVSTSPHIRDNESIAHIMWHVNLALAPAALFSVYVFGLPALMTMVLCIAAAVVTEFLIQKWQGKLVTVSDGSAFLTGLLLAMNIPATLPWYMAIIGSVVAIGIAKHTMGGLGYNIFNPALIGRAFLLASWPIAMTKWPAVGAAVDGVSSATPLGILKMQGYGQLVESYGSQGDLYQSLFFGFRGGSAGETSVILLLLGGIYLIYRGYINWQVPVTMIGTVAIVSWVTGGDPLLNMMAGGLMLGAFFMATDMVTIPLTVKGQVIFALGAGLLVVLIRRVGGYPEGVCYAILLMNAVTPLIDRVVKPIKFGAGR